MFETSDPNQMVAGLGVVFLLLAGLWRLIAWVREAPSKPDPWNADVEHQLEEPEAVEVCHHCLTQQPPNAWFCEHCGSAVGPYNNMMPYLNVFSEGEVVRNGAADRLRSKPLIIAGYLLFSLSACAFFAPIFWFFFFKNLKRSREEKPGEQPDGIPS
jgi:4-amino-4-deoxy-L-arabinose transferase-like glycosyltransferase